MSIETLASDRVHVIVPMGDQRVLHFLAYSCRRIEAVLVALVILLIHHFVSGATLPQGAFDVLLGDHEVP